MIPNSVALWSPAGAERFSDESRHPDADSHQSVGEPAPAAETPDQGVVNFQQVDWLDEHHHAVSAMLMQRGFVPLYPQLIKASGSLKAALMLGQAIGLSRTWLQRDRSRNGWFWMGSAEWQTATGLTPREQESAREALVEAGLWEERRTHNPSRLYFRVQLSEVTRALGLRQRKLTSAADDAEQDVWSWDDDVATNVLGESQMFFKPLADLAGGVMAGLLLSQLLSRQRTALRERRVDTQGHFEIRYDGLADLLLIGPKAMRNARDQLRRAGFISEQVRGSGPAARVHVGVNLAAMMACLQVQPTTAMGTRVAAARLAKSKPDKQKPIAAPSSSRLSGQSPYQPAIAGNRQFSASPPSPQMSLIDGAPSQNQQHAGGLTSQLEQGANPDGALLSIAKRAATPPSVDKVDALLSSADGSWCPFVESDGALLSGSYTENEYREPTTTAVPIQASVDNSDTGRSRSPEGEPAKEPVVATVDLVVPDGLDRAQALRVINIAPSSLHQVLLDELAGQMRSKRKSIDSPMGYLHVISRRAVDGSFLATMADDVARARTARVEAEARNALMLSGPTAPPVEPRAHVPLPVTPASVAVRERLAAQVKQMRSRIAAKASGVSGPTLPIETVHGGIDDK